MSIKYYVISEQNLFIFCCLQQMLTFKYILMLRKCVSYHKYTVFSIPLKVCVHWFIVKQFNFSVQHHTILDSNNIKVSIVSNPWVNRPPSSLLQGTRRMELPSSGALGLCEFYRINRSENRDMGSRSHEILLNRLWVHNLKYTDITWKIWKPVLIHNRSVEMVCPSWATRALWPRDK